VENNNAIRLRGVAVHNLKHVDLDLPLARWIVICGRSGSGKTSLAIDTLHAEGQRRYIESLSTYSRQFLEKLDKPDADSIDGIPASIAVSRPAVGRSSRATIGATTEILDHLQLLFARLGQIECLDCKIPVRQDTPESIVDHLYRDHAGARVMLAFPLALRDDKSFPAVAARLREDGLVRVIAGEKTLHLGGVARSAPSEQDDDQPDDDQPDALAEKSLAVVVDRLTIDPPSRGRIGDSLEVALLRGDGVCLVYVEAGDIPAAGQSAAGEDRTVDGRRWRRLSFSGRLRCERCNREYLLPEPRLFNSNSPLGACPACEGFGNTLSIDMERVVPDRSKSLREGAIAPWNTPAYAHELEELLALAADYDIPADAPVGEWTDAQWRLVHDGVPERKFGGVVGFFAWLERRKYKTHIRAFLSRWRSHHPCAACGGARLRPEALAVRIAGKNIAEVSTFQVDALAAFLGELPLSDWQRQVARVMLDQIRARLGFLREVGVGYLPLDRPLRTLSGGEAQRVALTSAMGSSLVRVLYVLDEPSTGLHPHDVARLVGSLARLRDRGNTVLVVEHDEAVLRAADHVVELGPGAGERGGEIVFQGTASQLIDNEKSTTGDWLAGRRTMSTHGGRRPAEHGRIRLAGARGNNLQNITVEFPLGLLCAVSGVSGAGKSTLVERTLYPALCYRFRKDAPPPLDFDDVYGDGQLDDVILIDRTPVVRSSRSNPVTYVKAFDAIRAVFAETLEARTNNLTPNYFSFNVDGGRCEACGGDGYQTVDMQFLPDVRMQCGRCGGRRYRREILEIKYRGLDISEILDMTAREAFAFFRGHPKVQARLKRLLDVGLDYLRLGQPASTLSGGESQRLKMASYLTAARRGRTLFILDEPTSGLHFSDVVQLVDCFDALLAGGHSLLVIEHNLQLLTAADYIIDLGPGAADAGGRVVAQGTPEELAAQPESITGRYLAEALAQAAAQREE
jgi:excinuclease ABC subunit A